MVWDDTARAMRNEMKNLNLEISGEKETIMKITSVVKVSLFAAALGFAALLPATVRAQSDVMPDSFAFSAEESSITQSADAKFAKADFEGKVSLPYDVKCEGKNLKAGQYSLSVRSEGISHLVILHGRGENVNLHVSETPANAPANVRANQPSNQATSQSALLVGKSSEGRKVEAVYVKELNRTLYLDTTSQGSHTHIERLPIS
jgi:hypothetical protein